MPSDIVGALTELGFDDIRVNGEEAVVLCPYHDDRKVGNFSVNTVTGVNHCFSCGESGQFIRIVQEVWACGRETAALWCQTRAAKGVRRTEEPDKKTDDDTTQQMNEAKMALFTAPPFVELSKRSIGMAAACAYGVLWDKDAWILVIRSPHTNELWGWQRKGTDGRVRNHPRGVRKAETLFGINEATGAGAVLVESPLDVVRLRTAGIGSGVSSYGVHVSDVQLSLITERFDSLVVALDNDAAGERLCEQLRRWKRLPVTFFNYGKSKAKDPGEMSDEEIHWGVVNATPGWRTRFG